MEYTDKTLENNKQSYHTNTCMELYLLPPPHENFSYLQAINTK